MALDSEEPMDQDAGVPLREPRHRQVPAREVRAPASGSGVAAADSSGEPPQPPRGHPATGVVAGAGAP
eukprot:7723522-Alexandrium_andersonii.AAC.1